mgnify:CR=1 FL=1
MILVKGGRVMDPATGCDEITDLIIDGEHIARIGFFMPGPEYEKIIHAEGKIVAPGLIDVHVHFRDPGLSDLEDIHSGTAATVAISAEYAVWRRFAEPAYNLWPPIHLPRCAARLSCPIVQPPVHYSRHDPLSILHLPHAH